MSKRSLCLCLPGTMKNKNLLLILGLGIVVVGGIGLFLFKETETTLVQTEPVKEEELIGGNRDEHGCLGPAGYSYDEEIGACIRYWELNPEYRQLVQIAVEHLGKDSGLTLNGVIEEPGGDGRLVVFQRADLSLVEVEVKDGQVVEAGQLEVPESTVDGSGQ